MKGMCLDEVEVKGFFFCASISAIHNYGVCCSDYWFYSISFFVLGSDCSLFWRRCDCKTLFRLFLQPE